MTWRDPVVLDVLPRHQAGRERGQAPASLMGQAHIGVLQIERLFEFGKNSIDEVLGGIDVVVARAIVDVEAHYRRMPSEGAGAPARTHRVSE